MNPTSNKKPTHSSHRSHWLRGALAAFATGCLTPSAVAATEYLNETLRTGSLPAGWEATNVTFTTAASGYAAFTGGTGFLETPVFDTSAGDTVSVAFSVAKFGSGDDGPITVEYSTDGGMEWAFAGNSQTPDSSTYINDSVLIYTASENMAVRFTSVSSPSDKRLRDVVISDLPFAISTLSPANGAPSASVNADLIITFNQGIQAGSGDITIFRASNDSTVESIPVSSGMISGNVLTVSPSSALETETEYYVLMENDAVRNLAGAPYPGITSDSEWRFTTLKLPVVVVNKYANVANGGASDLIELLVIGDETPASTLDMRGMIVKDFSSSMASDGGGKYEFNEIGLWQNVPVGTLIVLNGGSGSPDTNAADFKIEAGLEDTALFTKVGTGTFDIATTEMIMIKAAGSGENGVTGGIHALAAGTAGAQFNAFTGPKLIASGTTGLERAVIANNSNSLFDDYNGTDATGSVPLADVTFGAPNNLSNYSYLIQLRGGVFGDGDGVVTLANATPASPSQGTTVFGRGLSGQSVELTVNATLPSVTLTDVIIQVPGDFGAPGGVTLSGPAAALAGSSISGQAVTITNAAATLDDELVVTITGLDSPEPAIGDLGKRAFMVATSASGGIPASIPMNPSALVTIPILTLRETNASGVPVTLGQTVAVEGVATVNNFGTTVTQSALQDSTAGIALFGSTSPSPFVRGNRYVVYGPVAQFNGLTQVNYAGFADLGADTEPTPVVLTIPALLADPELYEGSLVTLQNLTYVSGTWASGQTVVLKDASDNNINIRIQAGSTATTEPGYPVNVTGVLGQFDNTSPFTSGYQLQPRDADDLQPGSAPTDTFASWIANFPGVGSLTGPLDDPDFDGIPNVLEHVLGLAPDAPNGAPVSVSDSGPGTVTLVHSLAKELASDVTWEYEWSTNLADWALGGGSLGGVTVTFGTVDVIDASDPVFDVVEVTATVTAGTANKLFVRIAASVD